MLPRKIAIPTHTVSQPSHVPAVHPARHRLARSLDHHIKSSASANAAGMTASSPRTTGAKQDATIAAAIHPRERTTSAFAISRKQSAAKGYASVSSTIHDEYASAGTAAAPAAANSAAQRPTSMRARK